METTETRYRIPAMDCAAEESEIRHALGRLPGIDRLRFDLGRRTLAIGAEPQALPAALDALRRIGYEAQALGGAEAAPEPACEGACTLTHQAGHHAGHDHDHDHGHGDAHGHAPGDAAAPTELPRLGAALLLATAAEALAFLVPQAMPAALAGMALAAVAIALAGFGTYRKGLAALRHGRLNINALMTVAVTGAFLVGQWPEAAMVMALYAIAELIEARSVDRARNAIQSLLALAPEEAEVQQAGGGWMRQPASRVAVGAVVRIRPGERIALDGTVTTGQGAVDQASVTGESIPVDKGPGDEVYAGTVNQASGLEIRVTATASNSTLARIIHAVEEAQASRAPTQRWVDRFAAVYTPAVFGLAVAVALLTPLVLGWAWGEAVYKALVLLVIACPCALVISTPVTVVSALASAARRGILVKGGVHLEGARGLRVVALDKTGTLTVGRPQLVAIELVGQGTNEAAVHSTAHSLAARSDHPVSQAIAQGMEGALHEVFDFSAFPGRGVQGRIDGVSWRLANHRWVEELGACSAALEARLKSHEDAGRSVSLLVGPSGVQALFAVADTLRPSAVAAVAELKALGVSTVMLTGDNPATAHHVAAQAGIGEVRAQLLPEDKLAALKELQSRHGMTAMVGDGINDAPALAQADIGFALGGAGTHTAMEAADVVIMNDDLRRLPETIRLSHRTHAVLWQNIVLALGIKGVFLGLAIFAGATMWMAVFADMGASLLVVFNGLRLLRAGSPRIGELQPSSPPA